LTDPPRDRPRHPQRRHRPHPREGAIGVSALGALLGHRVTTLVTDGLSRLGVPASGDGAGGGIPDVGSLPAPVRHVVEHAYGNAVAEVFLVAAPFALIAWLAIIAMREVPLRHTLDLPADGAPEVHPATRG